MNQINFLPDSFMQVQRRQRRRPIEFAIIGTTVVAFTTLCIYAGGPNNTLAQESETLDQALDQLEQAQAEQAQLEQEQGQLQRELLISRETYQPIRVTHVLARISSLAPEPVRLLSFKMVAQRPEPEAMPDPASKPNKRVVASARDNAADQPTEPNLMKITLTGLAPTDDEIVALIRKLDQDPVFSSVTLLNSKMTKTKTHFAREFKLEVVIDLDRRFVPPAQLGGTTYVD